MFPEYSWDFCICYLYIIFQGDRQVFDKLKKAFLLLECWEIFKGLPKWAVQMEAETEDTNFQDDVKEQELNGDDQSEQEVDDYAAELDKDNAIDWTNERSEGKQ